MTQTSLIMLAIALLIVWRMYKRIRRLIGRQQSRLWRHWFGAIFLPLLLLILALGTLASPLALGALVAGTAGGIALAWWGLRLTRYEKTAEGYFYTPNARIGIALSLLFAVRIGYRLLTLSALTRLELLQSMQSFGRSPLTLVILGTMLGYFTAYAVGMLRWRRAAANAPLDVLPLRSQSEKALSPL